ncbi:ABC transporter permease [Curtobacterium ammoniigenes]|uniref:ABC transporter permease n=1 Tax=Curtobacterium ammoniigenes TaxID=395387 RepID=UPI0008330FA5|nr:ABC transporter permease [Curtobacterium ammoniigenes]
MSGRSSIGAFDLLRLGLFGLRTRPTRVVLSALGIAIGIAAMVAVVGISSSSKAKLDQVLDLLGTNVLTIRASQRAELPIPDTAVQSVLRQDGVLDAAAVATAGTGRVYRSPLVPEYQSSGINVMGSWGDVPGVLGVTPTSGRWLPDGAEALPQMVLGSAAARALGIGAVNANTRVWAGGQWVQVVGVLPPVELDPELDYAAFVPRSLARTMGFSGNPERVHVRADPNRVASVGARLARGVSPLDSQNLAVSKPTDALAAKNASDDSFAGLLVGVGAVALLVGGIGVANTMVITVLERRAEIGVRRALGARRRHILDQFLVESLLLSSIGGIAGVAIGIAVTAAFAVAQSAPIAVPFWVVGGAVVATVVIGGVSGLYPSTRAARIPPTSALAAV